MSELSLDAFRGAVRRTGPTCGIAKIREQLDPKDRAVLDAALADDKVTGSAISRVLKDRGHSISQNAVTYHQRGDCRCGKATP